MGLLDDMSIFVEVVKARGFRNAAEIIGMPNSTVSRRIGILEAEIGLRLLHRTTRKLELTEAGRIYYERCKRIVDEAKLAHEQLDSMLTQPTGVLRAAMPPDFTSNFLSPYLAEFSSLYPGIQFELDLTQRHVDLVTEPYDVAIQMVTAGNPNLIARQLAVFNSYIFASPGYIEKHGEPQHPLELEHHECLTFTTAKPAVWTMHRGEESVQVRISGRFQQNSIGLMHNLARLDVGVVMFPKEIVAQDIARGRMVQILKEWEGASVPVFALTATRLLPAKTQCFIDFLKEKLTGATTSFRNKR